MARRFGSAMISNTDPTLFIYSTGHMLVKVYIRGGRGDDALATLVRAAPGSLVISQVRKRSDPSISSVCNRDHDYYFELLRETERDAQ